MRVSIKYICPLFPLVNETKQIRHIYLHYTIVHLVSQYADRFDYSEDACRATCEQLMYIAHVGGCCYKLSCNPLKRSSILGYTIPSNVTYRDQWCKGDPPSSMLESDKFSMRECEKKCKPTCVEKKYDISLSALKLRDGPITKVTPDHETAKVDVNMASFLEHTEVDSAKYDWSVLMSNIGGVMGLFTGFSVLTALEIVELMVDLWAYLCSLFCCRKK